MPVSEPLCVEQGCLHELPDVFGVGLVRDLIVLPTVPPVEDGHLALVSPRSTKGLLGTLSSYFAFMPSLTS